jgi:hypothetical protein
MLEGTPLTETIVPLTTHVVPPPVEVNAVEFAYPVPDPPIATVTPPANKLDTKDAVGNESYACRVSDPAVVANRNSGSFALRVDNTPGPVFCGIPPYQ